MSVGRGRTAISPKDRKVIWLDRQKKVSKKFLKGGGGGSKSVLKSKQQKAFLFQIKNIIIRSEATSEE